MTVFSPDVYGVIKKINFRLGTDGGGFRGKLSEYLDGVEDFKRRVSNVGGGKVFGMIEKVDNRYGILAKPINLAKRGIQGGSGSGGGLPGGGGGGPANNQDRAAQYRAAARLFLQPGGRFLDLDNREDLIDYIFEQYEAARQVGTDQAGILHRLALLLQPKALHRVHNGHRHAIYGNRRKFIRAIMYFFVAGFNTVNENIDGAYLDISIGRDTLDMARIQRTNPAVLLQQTIDHHGLVYSLGQNPRTSPAANW